jgi:GntR family transcriptional regulator
MRQRRWDSATKVPLGQASQPLYHKVYRQIAEEIESGDLRPGDRLPSERWLCDELGVSRATVRRAIEELVLEGLVEGRGRGSFVTWEALAEPRNTLISLAELGRSRGLEATARVLSRELRPATLDEAEEFGIAPGAELLELQRLRMLDGVPISLDHNRVPLRLLPAAREIDFTTASLYAELERAGHLLVRADYDVEARAVEEREAELLELAPGAPVLFTITVAMTDDGQVADLGRTIYRSDRYRFQATLTRRPQRERENEASLATRGPAGRARNLDRRLRRDARRGQAGAALGRGVD